MKRKKNKMKKIFILIFVLLLVPAAFALENFCGSSTSASCSSSSDCHEGGCSGQVCERRDEGTITTCEFRECYVAKNYNLSCQCIGNKCQWGYGNHTPFPASTTTTPSILAIPKDVYSFLTSINPIILIILGIILVLVAKLARFIGIFLIIFALIYFLILFLH